MSTAHIEEAARWLAETHRERAYGQVNGWLVEPNTGDTARLGMPDEDVIPLTNDELTVALWRTTESQLALLDFGADRSRAKDRGDDTFRVKDSVIVDIATDLATAILGHEPSSSTTADGA